MKYGASDLRPRKRNGSANWLKKIGVEMDESVLKRWKDWGWPG